MSRLIDADELIPDTEWDATDDGYVSYSQIQIDNIPTVQAVPIPENATNGDIIKAMFPNEELYKQVKACTYYGMTMLFDTDWWNAPYKRGDTE